MPAVHCAKNNLRIEEAEHITAGVDATVYVWLLCTYVLQQNIWHRNQLYTTSSASTVTGSVFMQSIE